MNKTLATLGIAGALILGATMTLPDGSVGTVPPIGFILDEPKSDAGNVRARMELLTGGGAWPDREIYVIVSAETHKDNLDVLKDFNVVSQKVSKDKASLEAGMPSGEKYIINFKE